MIRFFVTSRELSGPSHTLTGENAKHAKVLRLKAGEEVLLCDGAGQECLCTVADPESLTLTLGECRPSASEAKVRASVYMAFPKADKRPAQGRLVTPINWPVRCRLCRVLCAPAVELQKKA